MIFYVLNITSSVMPVINRYINAYPLTKLLLVILIKSHHMTNCQLTQKPFELNLIQFSYLFSQNIKYKLLNRLIKGG